MITVDSGSAKIRIWSGDRPDAHYEGRETLAKSIRAEAAREARVVVGAVERLQRGPRPQYALLGAAFHPDESSQHLTVKVLAGEWDDRRPFQSELVPHPGSARVGLPTEYANAVLDEAAEGQWARRLGAGTLLFDCAVCVDAWAANVIYRVVAGNVCMLLAAAMEGAGETELAALLRT